MRKILSAALALCLAFSLYASNNAPRTLFRNVVMEEQTGTWCGWCVRGIQCMKMAHEQFGDRFIGIAIHDGDIMEIVDDYFPLSWLSGYPSCSIDRDGHDYDPSDLDVVERELENEPDLEVSVVAKWNEDSTKVKIVSETEFWGSGSGYSIAYVLVADSLTGESGKWTQYNAYSGHRELLTSQPYMEEYIKNKFYLTHTVFNDVAIASSYVKGVNKAAPFTGPFSDGAKETNFFTLKLPIKPTELADAIRKDCVYVVAIVINADGTIANAAKAKVMDEPLPPPDEYVNGDISGDGVVDVSDYIGIANCIMGNMPDGFNEKAADVNKDGVVDVSDYIGVANLILYGDIHGK